MKRRKNPHRKTETLMRQAACLNGKPPPRTRRTVTPGGFGVKGVWTYTWTVRGGTA